MRQSLILSIFLFFLLLIGCPLCPYLKDIDCYYRSPPSADDAVCNSHDALEGFYWFAMLRHIY
jgi:hypothetical protein